MAALDEARFATEYWVMQHMGWSWADLQTTPAPVVHEIVARMQAEQAASRVKRSIAK